MDKRNISNSGNCYQCGKTFEKTAMKNHVLKEHNSGKEESFLLKIESAEYKDYWLYIDIPKSKKLEYIDKFLRSIWLECCGHMSRFAFSYKNVKNISKTRTIGEFEPGDEIYYEYDMGSTTSLYIKFIGEIRRKKQMDSVRLLARNIAPPFECGVCGAPAKFICTDCMYDEDESVCSLFCEKHSKKHEHNDMMLPIANSPRNGECGYTGDLDLYTFTGDLTRDLETSSGNIRKNYYGQNDSGDEYTDDFDDDEDDFYLDGGYDDDEPDYDILDELEESLLIYSKPFYTFKEFMETNTVPELSHIAKTMDIKNCSKLKKAELVSAISEKFFETDNMTNLFLILSENSFRLFNAALGKEELATDESIFDNVFAVSMHLIMFFYYRGEYYCVAPKEIQEIYRSLADENFFSKRSEIQNLDRYARAAANLYGTITLDDFADIFNNCNNQKKERENIAKLLEALGASNGQYGIWNGYLANGILYYSEDTAASIQQLEKLKEGKPHYIPPIEEFLRYESSAYYEKTAEVAAFKKYLKKNGLKDEDTLEEILFIINCSIKNGSNNPSNFIKILTERGFEFDSQASLKKCVELATEMHNATRMWQNNGHTPNEI